MHRGDKTEQGFQKKLAYHQWPDNYCDFSGMSGQNFSNYGVLGVPTLFLLDQEGTVLKKTAMVDELITFINKVNPVDPTLVLLSKATAKRLSRNVFTS